MREAAFYIAIILATVALLKRLKKHMENGSSLLPKMSFTSMLFRVRRKVNGALVKTGEGRAQDNGAIKQP